MLELRWLERAVHYNTDPPMAHMKTVLQYREHKLDVQGDSFYWTGWADVPTVTEESA